MFTVKNDPYLLSSGTLASLSGLRDYEAIDRLHLEFIAFMRVNVDKYPTWQAGWRDFFYKHCNPEG